MLSVSCLTKKYGNKIVLNNLSCFFPNVGMIGIYGESGSGKSTFLNIITGLEKEYEGDVFLNNCNIKNIEETLPKMFGIIFQHYNLLENYTVFENVSMPNIIFEKTNSRPKEALLKANVPKELWNREVNSLSGGEKQRVAIARAIVLSPHVIADEPTGALDKENSKLVFNIFKEISKTKLVIIVSHNLKLLYHYCDEVFRLNDLHNDIKITESKSFFKEEKNHDKSPKLIIKNHLKNNKIKYLIMIASMLFSMLFVSLSFSFLFMCKDSKTKIIKNYLDYQVFKISKIRKEKVDNGLFSYTQMMRPSISEVEAFKKIIPNLEYFYDLSLIFPSKIDIKVKEKTYKNICFLPYFSKNNTSFKDVIINDSLYKLIGKETFECTFNSNFIFEGMEEIFVLNQNFYIYETIEEMSFLNTPKIYYNYYQAVKIASKTFISTNKSIYEVVVNSPPTSDISNYQMILYLKNDDSLGKMYQLINKGISGYEITSNSISINKTIGEIVTSVELFLTLFGIILVVCSGTILSFIITSLIYDNKKETAILIVLGKKRNSFILNYLLEVFIMMAISILCELIFLFIIKKVFNILLIKYIGKIFRLKVLVPFIIVSFVALLLGFLLTLIVFKIVNKINYLKLLREE